MSTFDTRKLTSILKSIEVIEKKADAIHSEFVTSKNDIDQFQSILIDDTNTHLQTFFQYLEQLLQVDLRNRKSMINNKRNYWNFFVHALKESKGLYDTVLYVLNSQEVKTSTGRGRLFLRFCLQNHRLGDVIQQSFMITKVVHQFYHEDCFWTKQVYMDRIVQALYLLNDVQFDLLSASQYQLDVCWPTGESAEFRPKSFTDSITRFRTDSISSMLSMDSIASQSLISSSIPIMSPYHNFESSMNESSYAQSISSIDEYPENSVHFWKDRCQQLELQLQSTHDHTQSNDVEIQCSCAKDDQTTQTDGENLIDENILKSETEKFQCQKNILQDEINNLNFQLSSFHIQRTTSESKVKDLEREIAKYQGLLDSKDCTFNSLQHKYDEQAINMKSAQDQHVAYTNRQNKTIENLNKELENMRKLLENERESMNNERSEYKRIQEQLEASLHERTLDFEEMKRRLIKAIREKADLFNSIYEYEVKLEEEQARQWMHEDDVLNCSKCATTFGWTVRKYRCRHCQKIFCYSCSNHWHQGSTPNSQHRYCDFCHEKKLNESLMSNYTILEGPDTDTETNGNANLKFEVRSECLNSTADNESISQEQ